MMHSPGFDGNSSLSLQMLINADSLYAAAHCALLLNLKLSHGDYYRKRPALAPGMLVSAALRWDPPRTGGGLWAGKLSISARCGVALGMVGGDVMRLVQRTEPQSHTLLTEDSTRGAWKRLPAHSPVLSSSSNIKITHETRSKTRGQHVK